MSQHHTFLPTTIWQDFFSYISASNKDVSAPQGCVNERLNSDHPKELVHEELSATLAADEDGKPIPFQLQVHLDKLKRQYLNFIRHMQVSFFWNCSNRSNIVQMGLILFKSVQICFNWYTCFSKLFLFKLVSTCSK